MTSFLPDYQISSASKQHVRVPITSAEGLDPTGDVVVFAFPLPGGEPTTFFPGDWETLNGIYYARCLVGPGGVTQLAVGYYDVYVKITDNPEIPVLLSGLLEVT